MLLFLNTSRAHSNHLPSHPTTQLFWVVSTTTSNLHFCSRSTTDGALCIFHVVAMSSDSDIAVLLRMKLDKSGSSRDCGCFAMGINWVSVLISLSTRNFATSALVSLLRGPTAFVFDGMACSELSAFVPDCQYILTGILESDPKQLECFDRNLLRRMVRGGFRFVNPDANDYRYVINNNQLHNICGTSDVSLFINRQQHDHVSHIIRMPVTRTIKLPTFNNDHYTKRGRPDKSLLEQAIEFKNVSLNQYFNLAISKKT